MLLSLLLLVSLSLLIVSLLLFSLLPQNPHLPTYPLIGCLPSFYRNRRFLLHWYTDLLSLSPTQTITINRLGARRTIVTANPENVEHILKTNFGVYPKGKAFTEILGDFLGFGIFNVDGELWSTQRKLASHEFSRRSLREFVVKALEEEVEDRLYTVLKEAAESRRVLDLQDVLRRLAFDTICKISLGIDPCCLDLSWPLPPLITAFDTASEISAKRATAPVFAVWKLKRALNLGSEKKLPDRWLGEPGAAVSPYKFPVFQAGPRVCLGKEMAFIQMKYVVASVLRRFDVCPVGPDWPVFVPLLTAHMAGGLKVMVSKRNSM